jgi:two-component system LytT family response regulator
LVEPIRTLVVEDEPEAREGIADLLARDPEIDVVGTAGSGPDALAAVAEQAPELLLLDVQMPGLDGFGVLERIPAERRPVVVVVTAHETYALRAFEAHVADYLLKPFGDDRFAEALAHAKNRVRDRRVGRIGRRLAQVLEGAPRAAAAVPEEGGPEFLDRILVPDGERSVVVRVDEIDWIEARNYCARLHVGGREHLVRQTLKRLEARLDPARFVRVHRSAIVNLDRVRGVEPYFRGTQVLLLADGTKLPLSRSRRAGFERALGGVLH